MTAPQVKDPVPPLPIQLRMCINEASVTSTIVERVLNTHIRECPRRQEATGGECSVSLCKYFTWYLNHYDSCGERQVGRDCENCHRVVSWIDAHRSYCSTDSPCGLHLCSEQKKLSVKTSIKNLIRLNEMAIATATKGEVTAPGHTFEYRPPSYPSYDNESLPSETPPSSAGSSPFNTQVFESPQLNPEASFDFVSYQTYRDILLQKQPSVQDPSDQFPFCRSMSDTAKSLTQSLPRQKASHDTYQPGREEEEEKNNAYAMGSIDVTGSLDQSLHRMSPQPTSSLTTPTLSSQAHDDRPTAPKPSHYSPTPAPYADQTSFTAGQARPTCMSDSAIGSAGSSENDLSSIESITPSQPHEDTESMSTNSTLQPTTGSYSLSSDAVTPQAPPTNQELSYKHLESRPGACVPQQVSPQETCPTADALLLGRNCRPLFVRNPPSPGEVEATPLARMDHDWRESYSVQAQQPSQQPSYLTEEAQQAQQALYEQYYQSTHTSNFTEDKATIRSTLDHRASVREYLQGQFYHRQTYREHEHWVRVRQIGHGGQAKCFSIEDNHNKYLLCLKEEMENKKTLDETFICLKLATLVRDAPLNIVEFFGASILPQFDGNNRLQLFLELMPACLQGYVYQCGPLSPETTLNYSYQLFEALDYLHHILKVIHCDIKPANLLIDYNCQRLKVADFGCAELLDECRYGSSFPGNKDAGTLWYNPPEFYHDGNCGFGMDIWQAGCSVLFMATGRRPWRCMCMDVNNVKAIPSRAALVKKRYRAMIGEQSGGHCLPRFLSGGLRQLLSGCLRMEDRLSAKDCVYLTAISEALNHEQEKEVVEKLGYTPSDDVLLQFQSRDCAVRTVDVYLGKEHHCANIDGVPHAILNGWLGSVPYQDGMTYESLLSLVRQHLPVTQHFGECNLATYHNNPQVIWKLIKDKGRLFRVRPDQLVEQTKAFLLLPI